jgi:hypothetical protein
VNNKLYFGLYWTLLDKNLLKLLTVDELQLFIQFGRQFSNNFFALKDKVFAPLSLLGGRRSKIPIIFMTATTTAITTILEQTILLTGLSFFRRNIFWPGPLHMLQEKSMARKVRPALAVTMLGKMTQPIKLHKGTPCS